MMNDKFPELSERYSQDSYLSQFLELRSVEEWKKWAMR